MGILHSTTRFFGRNKTVDEEEEGETLFHSFVSHPRQNHSRSSERLLKILIFSSSIYDVVKGLLQKFLHRIPIPRKTAAPILPVQNLASSGSILSQTTLSSSPSDDSSADSIVESGPTEFAVLVESNTDDQRLECDCVDVISSEQQPEENDLACIKKTDNVREQIARANHVPVVEAESTHEDEREEEKVKIKSVINVEHKDRWIKHYSSRHRILCVGEGDFSFSASLAVAFGSASNIIATSLDSKTFLKKNYAMAQSNIKEIISREGRVMHEIDATEMADHPLLGHLKFDRIIYNFPYAGFNKNLSRESQLRRHRRLVSLFLKNAREMMSENGEIHISHKTNYFHVEFKLESTAASHKLRLIEEVEFDCGEYPGYNTKYGFGGDGNFNCYPSKTYKFGQKISYLY